MLFTAFIKDKETKEKKFLTMDYPNKSAFIKDLRNNGFAVNPLKVKTKEVMDYILDHTNCEKWDWLYINRLPENYEDYQKMIEEGTEKTELKNDLKFEKLMERYKKDHEQFLKDTGMTEEEFQTQTWRKGE
jgi:hypothetical protein